MRGLPRLSSTVSVNNFLAEMLIFLTGQYQWNYRSSSARQNIIPSLMSWNSSPGRWQFKTVTKNTGFILPLTQPSRCGRD